MTFEEYAKYRLTEVLMGWVFWALVFGVLGTVKLVLFIREVRRNHRNFERMRKELMEDSDDEV